MSSKPFTVTLSGQHTIALRHDKEKSRAMKAKNARKWRTA